MSIIVILSLYGLYHFLRTAFGLYAYPGADDITSAFFTKIIVKTGNHPSSTVSFYPYVKKGISLPFLWAFQAMPVIASFFTFIFQSSVPKMHLFLVQFSRGVTPLFLFSFIEILLRNQTHFIRKTCGISCMIVAIFSRAQYKYFAWGGMGERIGFNVALTLLICYLVLKLQLKKKSYSLGSLSRIFVFTLFFLFSLALMVYSSFRVLPLYVIGIFGLLILEVLKRDEGVKGRLVALGGVIGSLYLVTILGTYFTDFFIFNRFSPFAFSPRGNLILVENGNFDIYVSLFLSYFTQFHGKYTLYFLLFGFAGIVLYSKKHGNITLWYPLFTAIFLFLFSQSNPAALYNIISWCKEST